MNNGSQAVLSAAASFLVITLLAAVIYAVCKWRKRSRSATSATARGSPSRPRTSGTASDSGLTSIFVDQSASYNADLQISMAELVRATGNFADDGVIGDGGFGVVYKACLSDGRIVAAKKLSKDAFQGFREFRAEMDTLGKLRHENLVEIKGFCAWGNERILVYDYMENGSLDHWLHDAPPQNPHALPWDVRIRIVRGIADGLCYLHGLATPVIHRDIKASNVLLDKRFEAHIADFGLARQIESASRSQIWTMAAGTMGYMPPEYKEGVTAASTKADVYSFGVLMVEIATAKRPSWPVREGEVEMRVVQWASRMRREKREMEMMDSGLHRGGDEGEEDGVREEEVREFFRIACLCTSEVPRDRPTMKEVVGLLDQTWKK